MIKAPNFRGFVSFLMALFNELGLIYTFLLNLSKIYRKFVKNLPNL